jgi:hypothetical protein
MFNMDWKYIIWGVVLSIFTYVIMKITMVGGTDILLGGVLYIFTGLIGTILILIGLFKKEKKKEI